MKKMIFGVLALLGGLMAHGCGMVAVAEPLTLEAPVMVQDVTVKAVAADVVTLEAVKVTELTCMELADKVVCSATVDIKDNTPVPAPLNTGLPDVALRPMEQVCPFPQWPEHCEVVVTRSGIG